MSQQIQITGGAKVRNLEGVLTGASGVVSSLGINVPDGIPKLDGSGKILVSQLPNSVMEYKGTWDASTNTPTLANGTGNAGDVYVCSVAGTVNFGSGPIVFYVGDQVLYSGSIWQRASGSSGSVTSVAVTESGDSLTITGSPITTSGTINIGFAGNSGQYINGEGNLTTFPTIITQAQNLVTEVYNSTGATLSKGTIVYINGGQGNLPTITKAIATSDSTSAQTYGVVRADISNHNNGYVTVIGSLNDIDTQAYAAGTQLYLSGTTAGAWTSTKPSAPIHLVYIGIVVRSHPTQGVVEIKIQNGYELEELHDVAITSVANNDGIFYNSSNDLWENKTISEVLGYIPLDGDGTSGRIPYYTGTTTLGNESAFNYDSTLNRLGVNTSVPNATIGANAATDSGYSLLLKNNDSNYNSIGFATDSTYGNMISADRTGAAPSRNLTLYNYAGFVSITEAGNLGVGVLNPTTGVDIYNSTNAQLWLHNDASGLGAGNGLRLALFSSKNGNISNFDGPMSISSEGDFQVITLGAENIRVNSVDGKVGIGAPATVPEMLTVNGSIQQAGVLSSMLKTNGDGKIIAAVAGTDYVAPSSLSGYVPTSRTITINGTTQNLSADISYSVGTITGSGADGRVPFFNSTSGITSESGFIYDSSANRLGVNTISPNATIGANAPTDGIYSLLLKNSDTNYSGLGFSVGSTYGNTIETVRIGTAPSRNLTLYNYAGYISITESGNLGVNILTPNNGIDIYNTGNSQLWLHNNATGVSATDGVRLALFSNKSANLVNFDGPLSLTAEGEFSIITSGARNLWIDNTTGYVGIGDPSTILAQLHIYNAENAASLLLQTNGSTSYSEIAVRNASSVATSYFRQYSSSASGTDFGLSRANLATFFSNYASNFAIGTMNGGDLILGTANTERMRILSTGNIGIGTQSNISASLTIYSATEAGQFKLAGAAPAVVYADSLSTPSYVAVAGLTTAVNNFVSGSVVGDFVIANQKNYSILFATGSSTSIKMKLTSAGDLGIGTTSPDTKLDVRGEISLSYSANSGLRFYNQERNNSSSISNTIASPSSDSNLVFRTGAGVALTIAGTRDATFTTSVTAQKGIFSASSTTYADGSLTLKSNTGTNPIYLTSNGGYFALSNGGSADHFLIASTGAATFSSSVADYGLSITNVQDSSQGLLVRASDNDTGLYLLNLQSSVGATSQTWVSRFVVEKGGGVKIYNGGAPTAGDGLELWSSTSYSFVGSYNRNTSAFKDLYLYGANTIFENGGSARMRITSVGQLIIGSAASTSSFVEINGGSSTYGGGNGHLKITSESTGQTVLNITNTTVPRSWEFAVGGSGSGISAGAFYIFDNTAGAARFVINTNGYIFSTPTYNNTTGAAVNMYVDPSGVFARSTSSLKYKKDVRNYDKGLAEVMQMRSVYYKGTSEMDGDKQFAGLIAEEVQDLGLTEFVQYAADGTPDALAYDHMVAILVKAIQELKLEIDQLKKINNK